ncbi:MAG: NRDE family protein [Candidatus Microbacterium stercoravium]
MCTVIIRIPHGDDQPVQLLAVRDEDPGRAWDPLGAWWPDRPGVVGVRDRRSGGAWLAAEPAMGRLAVVLNREGEPDLPEDRIRTRGALPLDALAHRPLDGLERMRGFNLVTIAAGSAEVTSWTGSVPVETTTLAPGTHMLAHDDVDDPRTARIIAWREEFARASFDEWPALLAQTASVGSGDDRAIVRDNRAHGYPTLTTLVCVAEVFRDRADVRYAALDAPAEMPSALDFRGATGADTPRGA